MSSECNAMIDIYRIRPAAAEDIPAILDMIGAAARWLRTEKGTDQWARPWPDRQARDARVVQGIENGLTWMLDDQYGTLAGTITCRERGNDVLWSPAELRDPAVYVSRLIVGRQHAGLGIGTMLIDWAGMRGREEWRANWIRVDVWTTNTALHQYYKGQGFEHLRTLQFPDPWDYPSAALFQKPTTDIDTPGAAWPRRR
jgi:GNAT superfamily N-acetyltransferase